MLPCSVTNDSNCRTKPDSGDVARISTLEKEIQAAAGQWEKLEGDKAAIRSKLWRRRSSISVVRDC